MNENMSAGDVAGLPGGVFKKHKKMGMPFEMANGKTLSFKKFLKRKKKKYENV